MKRFNVLDISMAIVGIMAAVILGVFIAHVSFGNTARVQITLNMTEDTDSAKYIKIGDDIWLENDTLLGSVSSIKSLESGGIAITLNATLTVIDGAYSINSTALKLGKSYSFRTKRITGVALCDAISGE